MHNRDIISIFFNMKVFYVLSLESPQRGDSNEYTQYTIFQYEKENFQWTQERVRNRRGNIANSVRAIEVLLYRILNIWPMSTDNYR